MLTASAVTVRTDGLCEVSWTPTARPTANEEPDEGPAASRHEHHDLRLLERRRPQLDGDRVELAGIRAALRTVAQVVVEPCGLELGELAVETAGERLARGCAFAGGDQVEHWSFNWYRRPPLADG
jgi:hypothetical protein